MSTKFKECLQCSQQQIFQTNRILIMSRLPNENIAASKQPVPEAPRAVHRTAKGEANAFPAGQPWREPRSLACFSWAAGQSGGKRKGAFCGTVPSTPQSLHIFQYFKRDHWNWNWWQYYFLLAATRWMDGLPSNAANSWLPFVMCVLRLKNSCFESIFCYACADVSWKIPVLKASFGICKG